MAQQAEIQATRVVGRIREILGEVRDNPDDYDLTKAAVEIYSILMEGVKVCPRNYNSFEILCNCEDCTRSNCPLFLKESGQLAGSVLGSFEKLNHFLRRG